ncbi:MAG: nickel-dependent lactate racemase [Clostridia bacterium]|nr:nickel-dependent lactate racemase [Clostridia bacterium]
MKKIFFPYGKGHLEYTFDDGELSAVLTSSIEEYIPEADADELVERALREPVGSASLSELARGKNNVVIIASDHTRPVPSKVIMPKMLREIRRGNPDADITILIATGCHRGSTKAELVDKFGEEIVGNENIYIHNCDESEKIVNIGVLPSGGECEINKIAYEADLLVAEGFIEPHFFAGFSGGRKSILPGIAGRTTVLANHCSEFIAHPRSRTGMLDGNPIHRDMLWAAKQSKLAFIVNVVLDSEKEPIYAVAGDFEAAHKKGTDFISGLCAVSAEPADIVISTNGGYPLDQNVYQAVKGMTAAEAAVKDGGVIVMIASSVDGTGGDHFYHQLADEADISKTMALFLSRNRCETVPDQWESQILLRILSKASVIYVSEMPGETVRAMHMIPAASLSDAISLAKNMLAKEKPSITAIPDGISVIVNSDRQY